ncbi:MAG: Subtilase family protein [Planctomycetes bacterium ADurb.Bin126]|nr:MAG: Subtilase family protein [Planctomycetes bacterium ADurb.Bin126]HOD83235.1 S8 family peptidase [Phycisphaerae bacterium]HQL71830.1 S8 family peptidase [Phycisphaerae bacterium]
MSNLRHIQIEQQPSTGVYTYPRKVISAQFKCPPRDRAIHAHNLKQQIQQLTAAAVDLHPEQPADSYGLPVEFHSDPNYLLKVDSLEYLRSGIELANVRENNGTWFATVYIPPGKMSFFLRRIDKYALENDKRSGEAKNKDLVESIAGIRLAATRSFWTDETTLFPQNGQAIWWEVWLRCPRGARGDPIIEAFKQEAAQAITLDDRVVRFEERAVLLAWCMPQDWADNPNLMDRLAELRKAKEPAGPYVAMTPADQAAFVQELLSRVTPPPGEAPAVCVLDTGVDWGHPLLAAGMQQASAFAVNPNWLPNDHNGHGTEVAGLCLYGCLTNLFPTTARVALAHCIESVKILPSQGLNDPKNYGAITQEAIARVETAFPTRDRSVCLAVTADGRDQGFPTLWSAAIDQYCSGELDDKRRLMFVSAGNVRDLMEADSGYRYPHTNYAEGIQDPAQSWNAVTVGACTDLVRIHAADRQGWNPIALKGRLCPASTTSMLWGHEWPIKPDIVMEGGNYAIDGLGRIDAADDLSLLTTARPIAGRLLTTFGDTSAATALAARMGAIIQSRYPGFWPETVRGLMVHSAEWTPEMLAEFPYAQRRDRLRCYGWGIPQLERAIWSAENAVTLIYEGQLQPYDKTDGKVKTKDMHVHALPWPADVLQQFPAESVRMRVTLSYFIEPSPGRQGWTRKHRYASYGLRFDVKRPTESLDDFRNRLSSEVQAEDEENEQAEESVPAPQAGNQPWALGQKLRARGSIHSDWWVGSASELAACGCIGVFPVTGWWRERHHLERWNREARYSLIVTLETPRTDIDLYTSVATQVGITPQIEI